MYKYLDITTQRTVFLLQKLLPVLEESPPSDATN